MKIIEQETTKFDDTLEELRTSLSDIEKATKEIIHTNLSMLFFISHKFSFNSDSYSRY